MKMMYAQNCTPHRVLKNKTPEEVFSDKKPKVIHLKIFGCPVYIHFESSMAYRIYFLGFKKINISMDMTFDKDLAYNKSRKKPAEEPEEVESPRIHDTIMNKETEEEDREFEEPQRPVDPP